MQSSPFGTTGLAVTKIGLGLAALGRPAYVTLDRTTDLGSDRSTTAMERRCHGMLDAAYGQGIRYVDTARSYGRAEDFLAAWLRARELSPAALTVGSKWGYAYTGGWQMDAAVHESKDLSLAMLQRQIRETRGVLGNHLDLYQIHSATLESGVLEDAAVMRELARLRSDGMRVGLTVTGPRQSDTIRRALTVHVDGVRLFQSIQATWNLLERSAGMALAEAHALGLGVIVKEVLANGRLTDAHGGSMMPPLAGEAAARRTTIDALAFAAALSQPWVDIVLSGAVTIDQLASNLAALSFAGPTSDGLDLVTPEEPAAYWTRRSRLAWN